MYIYQILLPEEISSKEVIEVESLQDLCIKTINHNINSSSSDIIIDDSGYSRYYGFNLSGSEIDNFLTHRKIWEDFIESKLDWCLIVESNVSLKCSEEDIIDTVAELNKEYTDWDFFYPYDAIAIHQEYKDTKNGNKLINVNIHEVTKNHLYLLNFKWGNSIYFISSSGAKKMLEINTIKNRLDDTIIELASNDSVNLYYKNVKWFDYKSIIQYEWLERCELILNNILKNKVWDALSLKQVKQILKAISDIAIKKDFDLLLSGGTFLGYIRHGGIMPWDDDIDIAINCANVPTLFSEIEKQPEYAYKELIEEYSGVPFYKIWLKNGTPIEGAEYTFPFIDLWPYTISDNNICFNNGKIWPNTGNKFNSILFEEIPFKIAPNIFEVLDSKYSDWRNHIHIYCWSHKEERPVRSYTCIPIRTDKHGRANFPKLDNYL